MAKVSISEAARLVGISRQHLYKRYLSTGLVSVEKDGANPPVIDISELLRVFGKLEGESQQAAAPGDPALLAEINALRRAAAERDTQLQEAREREVWLRQHIGEMTGAFRLLENKNKDEMLQGQIKKSRELVRQYKEALAEEQRQIEKERSRGFWSRLFNI